MANPLTLKVEQYIRFDQAERRRLDELLSFPTQTFGRGELIIKEGEKVHHIHLVLTGLAARCKHLASVSPDAAGPGRCHRNDAGPRKPDRPGASRRWAD